MRALVLVPTTFSFALRRSGKRRAVNVVGHSDIMIGSSEGSGQRESPTGPLSCLSSTPSPPSIHNLLAPPPQLHAVAAASHDPVPTYQIHTEGIVIDGTVFGNIARFFNHSCDPNMKVRRGRRASLPLCLLSPSTMLSLGLDVVDQGLEWKGVPSGGLLL